VGTTISVSGSGKADITVFGRGTVIAGNGNDSINIMGGGNIIVGSGHDTLTLGGPGGVITEHGASGHDTINIGAGNATVYEQGHATITGAFGTATISGGVFEIHQTGAASNTGTGTSHSAGTGSHTGSTTAHSPAASTSSHTGSTAAHSGTPENQVVGSPHMSAIDSALRAQLLGSANAYVTGATGNYTFITGAHQESLVGSSGHNQFQTLLQRNGSTHVINNFVSGQNQLYVEGHSLAYLQQQHDISTHGGNTYISIDGGGITIELKGVSTLKATDFVGKH
jgi:hypothetical protein